LSKRLSLIGRAQKKLKAEGFRSLSNSAIYKFKKRLRFFVVQKKLVSRLIGFKLELVNIELTNACNLHCRMCLRDPTSRPIGYMSFDLYKSLVNQLAEMKVHTLLLNFDGESLLHPQFKQFLSYAIQFRDQGKIKAVGWIDNGMLFTRDVSDLVVELQVDFVTFSIDGIGKVNDNIRLGSSYSIIEENINYLLHKRGNGKKPEISLITVDYGKSKEDVLQLIQVWCSKVSRICLTPCTLPNYTLANPEGYFGNRSTQKLPFCPFPFEYMAIRWDGRVAACCADGECQTNLGDATQHLLRKIWNNDNYKEFRRMALANSFPESLACHTCSFWETVFIPAIETILNGAAEIYYTSNRKIISKKLSSTFKSEACNC